MTDMFDLNNLQQYVGKIVKFRCGEIAKIDGICGHYDGVEISFDRTIPFPDGVPVKEGTSGYTFSDKGYFPEFYCAGDIVEIIEPLQIPETLLLKDYSTLQWLFDNFEAIEKTHIIRCKNRDSVSVHLSRGEDNALHWYTIGGRYYIRPLYPDNSQLIFEKRYKNHINSKGVGLSKPK